MAHFEVSACQTMFTALEPKNDQSRPLADAESQDRQNVKKILTEGRYRLEYYLYLLISSQKLLCSDVDRTYYDYLRLLFDAAGESTAVLLSVSQSQFETHVKTLHQKASSLISSSDQPLPFLLKLISRSRLFQIQ